MPGMSERQYAAHAGVSRGAVQKARLAGRLVLNSDGTIDAAASDVRRHAATDPAKQRKVAAQTTVVDRPPRAPAMKPVPDAALSALGDTLREQGMAAPAVGSGTTFLQAKTANEVLKAQERRLKLQKLKGELIDRARATALVFRLAREERDAWVNWPGRVAAVMAAELSAALGGAAVLDTATVQTVLEQHLRRHLDDLSDVKLAFR
ncbi:MAG: hypothetical protein INR68_05490 [Methylobacterium mesophilicum]|nr:hypothetical protein [Methylobacterium mesophilicum]